MVRYNGASDGNKTNGQQVMAEDVHVKMHPDLKNIISEMADGENRSMSEIALRLIASAVGRPDLALPPRRKLGRPRKALATSV